jgi:hypothetical protein
MSSGSVRKGNNCLQQILPVFRYFFFEFQRLIFEKSFFISRPLQASLSATTRQVVRARRGAKSAKDFFGPNRVHQSIRRRLVLRFEQRVHAQRATEPIIHNQIGEFITFEEYS